MEEIISTEGFKMEQTSGGHLVQKKLLGSILLSSFNFDFILFSQFLEKLRYLFIGIYHSNYYMKASTN